MVTLLPEWVNQEAIILAWPDKHTDWQPWLKQVQHTYLSLINAITRNNTMVILLVRHDLSQAVHRQLSRLQVSKVLIVPADYNDTWVRDYAFLTGSDGIAYHPIEFMFNGWGQKFNADKDNAINATVLAQLCQRQLISHKVVLEGGALEINEHGHLLSTQLCLTNPKRNGAMSLANYASTFADTLGVKTTTLFRHGHLEGDDTDGHIDTLVRFTPNQGVVIQSAFNRSDDSHFDGLSALKEEVSRLLPKHELFELPLPIIKNDEDERLPASYANFLINNRIVLTPIYQQPEDELALSTLRLAFPNHSIVPIDSVSLIQQFGSIHCISMQVPSGTLKPEVVEMGASGVSIYDW